MPADPALVEAFLAEVDATIYPALEAHGGRLRNHQGLVTKYRTACSAWRSGRVGHIRGIAEAVNELCVARCFLEETSIGSVDYELRLGGTDKTIDFLVCPTNGQARIFYDVKTIHPEERDAWERYKRAKSQGWFTPNTELVLDKEWMGGALAHELFACREKFLEYTLELEEKIRHVGDRDGTYFRMVFCGDGFQWRKDHLEDFAETYLTGHYSWDHFATMEAYSLKDKGKSLDRSIHGFCYFQRSVRSSTVAAFVSDVRGPRPNL